MAPGRLFRPDHQIVAMHHFGAAAKAEDGSYIRRRAAADFLRVLGIEGA
jgi:hypothetical protein